MVDVISREAIENMGDRANIMEMLFKAYSFIVISLGDEVLREVSNGELAIDLWEKLESIFVKRSLTN